MLLLFKNKIFIYIINMTNNIFDEYVQYHDAAIKSYGPKTCVFLHAGQFYELYAFCPDEDTIIGPNLYRQ